MSQKKPAKQASGGARLKAAGKRAVLIGLTPDQDAKISAAAKRDGRPITQFLTHHGLVAAEKILEKSRN